MLEAKLLNRNSIGIYVNPDVFKRCRQKLQFDIDNASVCTVRKGDARKLSGIQDNSIDLICTHPPYANIISYSKDLPDDLSLLKVPAFFKEMGYVVAECFRVLKEGAYCAILMGDTRKNGHINPMGFRLMEIFINAGFTLKEIIMKQQHNCKTTGFWKSKSLRFNFLLLAHEYLFIFHKQKIKRKISTLRSS